MHVADPPNVLLLFALGLVTDVVWCSAVHHVSRGHALRAALGNAVLAAITLGSTWAVIEQRSLPSAFAYIAGCALGTFFTINFRSTNSAL